MAVEVDPSHVAGTGTGVEPSLAPPATASARRGAVLKEMLVGAVFGIDAIGLAVALSVLVFVGPLSPHLASGTGLFLLGTAIFAVVLALRSTFYFGSSMTQDVGIAILGPAVAIAIAALPADADPETQYATALAVLGASTLLTGATLWLMGRFNLSRVARVLPFPVAAGFLASSGWLLLQAGLLVSTGGADLLDAIFRLLEPAAGLNAALTVLLAAALFVAVKLSLGTYGVVGALGIATGAFFVGLAVIGMSLEEARALGFLQGGASSLPAATPSVAWITQADWAAVAAATALIVNAALLNTVGFVLNTSGTELTTKRDVDMEREMRDTGAANLFVSLFGGPAGYVASGNTSLAFKIGCRTNVVGLTVAATCVIGFFFADAIVSHVPVFVASGLLMFIGYAFVDDWLFGMKKRLARQDWLIILAIFLTTIWIGILPAIMLGLALTVAIFVYDYSRQPVTRRRDDLSSRRSVVDRSTAEDRLISNFGRHALILELQGYMFFGSATQLLDLVKKRMERVGALYVVVVDFRAVSGLDPAACATLEKLRDLTAAHGAFLAFTNVRERVRIVLRRWGSAFDQSDTFRRLDTLDDGLEWAEDRLLRALSEARSVVAATIDEEADPRDHPRYQELLGLAERIERRAGVHFMTSNTIDESIYVVESGRVSTYAAHSDATRLRTRSLTAGGVFGGFARYFEDMGGPTVVIEEPTVLLKFSGELIDRLDHEDPELGTLVRNLEAKNLAIGARRNSRMLMDTI